LVYDSQDRIKTLAWQEAGDQIHSYLLEWAGIGDCGDLVQGDLGLMREDFALLANRASLHVIGNPFLHPRPPQALSYLSEGFVLAQVPGGCVVMMDT
jgi:hypothetical protein